MKSRPFSNAKHALLAAILVLALALRLWNGLMLDPMAAYGEGGDSRWYLLNGYALITGFEGDLTLPGVPGKPMPIHTANLPTAPLYLIFAGLPLVLLPSASAIVVLRLIQAVMGTATCYFAYRLARGVSERESVGLLAGGVLAVSPVFVLETAHLMTETLYVFWLSAGLMAYVEMVRQPNVKHYSTLVLIALFLGLATLTRAVLLLFPLGLALHLLIVYGWREGFRRAAVLIVVYGLVVSIWTIYNRIQWNRWVIGADGFSAFLYISTTGWQGPTQTDAQLAEDAGVQGQLPSNPDEQQKLYREAAAKSITSDPLGWLSRRVGELAGAYLQPHGTIFFPGDSLKDLLANWLSHDRSLSGLVRLAGTEGFWPKVIVYSLHYACLLLGLAGMWLTRRNWRVTLPLIGFILYTSLIHLLLDAIPRYIFPTEVVWWVFAAVVLVMLWERVTKRSPLTGTREKPVLSQG